MTKLTLDRVSKDYGTVRAVDGVSLEVEQGELVALLGPSGCGKTTLLRIIAGFVPTTSGRVSIGDRDVTGLQPHLRNTGMVFQKYALFPHMTVGQNIAFGLEMRKVPSEEKRQRVAEALTLVHMEDYFDRFPRELSGGQQQRVAVARALVVKPDVFLLDEPLSNLDAKLRQSVGQEIRALQKRLGLTTVFVTHDQNEALILADRLVVMKDGRVIQSGSARELYNRPRTRFVAGFLGDTNLLSGTRTGREEFTTESGVHVHCLHEPSLNDGSSCVLSVRPENILIGPDAEGLANHFTGQIENTTYLGGMTEYAIRLSCGECIIVQRHNRIGAEVNKKIGDQIPVGWSAESGLLISSEHQ